MQAVPRRTQAGPGPAGSRRMPPGSLYELTALWERRKPGAGRLAQDNGCWGSRRAPESSRGPRGTRTDGRPFRPVWFRPRVPQHSPQVRSRITLSGSSATSYATRLFHGVSERSQPVPSQPTAQETPPRPQALPASADRIPPPRCPPQPGRTHLSRPAAAAAPAAAPPRSRQRQRGAGRSRASGRSAGRDRGGPGNRARDLRSGLERPLCAEGRDCRGVCAPLGAANERRKELRKPRDAELPGSGGNAPDQASGTALRPDTAASLSPSSRGVTGAESSQIYAFV